VMERSDVAMKSPQPILVTALFPEVLEALFNRLSAQDWNKPTVCARWSVKDIATHLLGGQFGILSRKRDGYAYSGSPIKEWDDLVTLINDLNDIWVKAASRLSPPLLCDLLKLSGDQVCAYFKSLDPYAIGDPVDWAGPERAPVWLDLAREYTEWWHHQQQIRDAVGKPGLKEPRFFAPVLDAFVRALPHTYRKVEAKEGTLIALTISGNSGRRWLLRRVNGAWRLHLNGAHKTDAELVIDQEIAWRLFTKGISKDNALAGAALSGDQVLASKALEMISVIA
jgi:uncharacterized protein (TIGR03083 family)